MGGVVAYERGINSMSCSSVRGRKKGQAGQRTPLHHTAVSSMFNAMGIQNEALKVTCKCSKSDSYHNLNKLLNAVNNKRGIKDPEPRFPNMSSDCQCCDFWGIQIQTP